LKSHFDVIIKKGLIMKKHYLTAIACSLFMLSCGHPNEPGTIPDNTDTPGYFSLTQLQGLQKTNSIATAYGNNTINLGDLHSTTNYYFLLTNCGGHCITDIKLSVSDSSFQIYPTSIDSLTVGLGTQALVPIIKLTAIHGIGAQGIGNAPIMSKGIHQVHLSITGLTKQKNIDTSTSLTATLTVNAFVMDFDIHSAAQTIDLINISGFANGLIFDKNYMLSMVKSITVPDSIFTIVNTGNVAIKIKAEKIEGSDSSSCVVNVNDSARFNANYQKLFRFDGNNTVSDPVKLPKHSDGNAYLLFGRSEL
jgi:hypothetical protein